MTSKSYFGIITGTFKSKNKRGIKMKGSIAKKLIHLMAISALLGGVASATCPELPGSPEIGNTRAYLVSSPRGAFASAKSPGPIKSPKILCEQGNGYVYGQMVLHGSVDQLAKGLEKCIRTFPEMKRLLEFSLNYMNEGKLEPGGGITIFNPEISIHLRHEGSVSVNTKYPISRRNKN